MINLDSEVVKEIVNTLVVDDPESRELYLQSINNESGKGTQNSRGKHKWDYIYNSFILIAEKFGLNYVKLGRSKLWDAVVILGHENELYVFFRKPNLKNILKSDKDHHYLKLLNLFNEDLDEMKPLSQQLKLPIDQEEEKDKDYRKLLAKEMLQVMQSDPSKVIVFTFDTHFISTVQAFVFNSRNESVWEKDLTQLIDVNYQPVLKNDNVDPEERESRNINKTKKEKKRIVKLKS